MKTTLHSIKVAAAPWAMADVNTLEGWAVLPANTFSDGPTSGQFAGAGAGGNPLPPINQQAVGTGSVSAIDCGHGAALPGLGPASHITLADPDRKLGFAGTVTGDSAESLRINAFDVDSEQFGAKSWLDHLESDGTNMGDMTALNDNNYPGAGGRNLGSDNTEFLKNYLAAAVPEPQTWAPMLAGFGVIASVARRRRAH